MSATVTINQGVLARLLRQRGGRAYRKVEDRTRRAAQIAEELAPGSMGRYVSWEVVEGRKGLEGVVTCDHPAVLYVLKGTRPHLIRPRHAKVLHFIAADGEEVFTTLVRHPGTRPNDFMGKALRLSR